VRHFNPATRWHRLEKGIVPAVTPTGPPRRSRATWVKPQCPTPVTSRLPTRVRCICIDLNLDPAVTDLARCVLASLGTGIRTLLGESSGVLCAGRIRRLTPRVCCGYRSGQMTALTRCMPSSSDSQAYEQAGNGVTVHLVEAIGRRIAKMDAELRADALAP